MRAHPYYPAVPLVLSHPRQPPGGHSFMDPSGYLLRADSLPKLLDAIALYRKNNGFSKGSPAAEVESVYANNYPWLVSKVGMIEAKTPDPVARWLERAWKTPEVPFAESDPAEKRTATCIQCQHYRPDHIFDADALRRITILGRGKYNLKGACAVHHWPVGLAVWMDAPDTARRVDGCWAI